MAMMFLMVNADLLMLTLPTSVFRSARGIHGALNFCAWLRSLAQSACMLSFY